MPPDGPVQDAVGQLPVQPPAAPAEQQTSQTAYTEFDAAEAQDLLEEKFAEQLTNLDLEPLRAIEPDSINGFLGDDVAVVDVPDQEKDRVVVSTTPLRAENEEGDREPLDARLERDGASYRAINPVVEVALPVNLADPVRLEASDVGIRLRSPEASQAEAVRVGDDKLFYHEAAPDTDVLLAPVVRGAELFTQLRSPAAPERLSFEFALPAGATVRDAGQEGIEIVREGQRLALIAAPSALDAQGAEVEARLETTAAGFDLVVPHRSAGHTYPILVDPPYEDWFNCNWYQCGNQGALGHWNSGGSHYATTNLCWNGGACWGPLASLYIYAPDGWGFFPGGTWAEWAYSAPGWTTYIPDATLGPMFFARGGDNCCYTPHAYWGLHSYAGGFSDVGTYGSNIAWDYQWLDGDFSRENVGPWANRAVIGMATSQPGRDPAGWRSTMLGGALISLEDPESPTLAPPSGTGVPSGWVGAQNLSVTAQASDPGLGVQTVNLYVPDPQGEYQAHTASAGCGGSRSSGICPWSFAPTIGYDTAQMPEGVNPVAMYALDPQGWDWASEPQEWEVKVDRSPPELHLSGDLVDQDRGGGPIQDSYPLHVETFDGSADDPRSGVKSIEVKVDGTRVAYQEQACDAGSCPMQLDWEFKGRDHPIGTHTVTVIATDQLGHPTTQTLDVESFAGVITLPKNGDDTYRYFALQGTRQDSTLTHVSFQYRRASTDPWTEVPVDRLQREDGSPLSSLPLDLDESGTHSPVVWDVPGSPGLVGDGPIQIRGVFTDDGGHTGISPKVTVTLAHDGVGSKHAGVQLGPGSVDLLTGNFATTADDVSIDSYGSDLTVTRTFNSRDPNANPSGPFGPGWVSSVAVDAAGSDYKDLVDGGSYALVTTSDGTLVTFLKEGTTYVAEAGYQDLQLSQTGGQFSLKDLGGNVTTFGQPQGTAANQYLPVSVKQPGTETTSSIIYEVAAGVPRIARIIAPAPAGITCAPSGSLGRGCRALDLQYANATTATGQAQNQWGDYAGRIKGVSFSAYDPQGATMSTTGIVSYQYDNTGRLRAVWDPRISPALKTTYAYTATGPAAGTISEVAPPGEAPWLMSYINVPGDANPGHLRSVERKALTGTTSSLAYQVPVSGGGAPHEMSASEIAKWGQTDRPTDATAVFPAANSAAPDPPTTYEGSAIHYLNRNGDEVNVAAPDGGITTTEHNQQHGVRRELSAQKRALALVAGDPAARSRELDVQRIYSADGTELLEELGPMHEVQLGSGEIVQARQHTVTTYDEGAPQTGGPHHLPTTVTTGARIPGRAQDADVRTTTTEYDWTLRKPTVMTTDPGGLNLTTKTFYDSSTGLPTQSRAPKANDSGTDAHTTKTIYYSAGSGSSDPACNSKPEWANLPCKVQPGGQPTGPHPPLPITTYEYNRMNQVTKQIETAGAHQRTTTTTYDAAGRVVQGSVASDVGTALQPVTTSYDPATGRLTSQSMTEGGSARTLSQEYDSRGRLIRYTDADGATTVSTYDNRDRLMSRYDGTGSQTYTYDSSDRLTGVHDSAAGDFTATYDFDGQLVSKGLPNGLRADAAFDEVGSPTKLTYTKVDDCASACPVWLSFAVSESIHGQWMSQASMISDCLECDAPTDSLGIGAQDGITRSFEAYSYDAMGRLTQVQDTRTGEGCTVRDYQYDRDSNRTKLISHEPTATGGCNPSSPGTSIAYSYDDADRSADPISQYDGFGRQTKLAAQERGGGALSATYYVNDRISSLTQDGISESYKLDPLDRPRTRTIGGAATEILHYSSGDDAPSWIDQGSGAWTRYIEGIDGDLAAVQTTDAAAAAGSSLLSDVVGGAAEDLPDPVTLLELTNLHGDVVAEASANPGAPYLLRTFDFDEFGVPSEPATGRYGWLGGKQRATELPSGIIGMGQRVYVPQAGRFLQTDPVPGGSANDYDYSNQDPLNQLDLDGTRARRRRGKAPRARVAASLPGRGCRTVQNRESVDGELGNDVVTVYMKMRFCWNKSRRRVYVKSINHFLDWGGPSLLSCDDQGVDTSFSRNAYINHKGAGRRSGYVFRRRRTIACGAPLGDGGPINFYCTYSGYIRASYTGKARRKQNWDGGC